MRCLTSVRYSMTATVLSQGGFDTTPESYQQDPNTGEIIRVWSKDSDAFTAGEQPRTIRCVVRGIISKTTRGEGTSLKITAAGLLEDTDYVMMDFPSHITLSKRDRVTDIKNRKTGKVLWAEEEHTGLPTVFQVMGVTPMFDPFGLHIANHALLARSEVQT